MTPFWPTLDRRSGLPTWIRADLRAMPPAYVSKVPARNGRAGVVDPGWGRTHPPVHPTRANDSTLIVIALVLVGVVVHRMRRHQ